MMRKKHYLRTNIFLFCNVNSKNTLTVKYLFLYKNLNYIILYLTLAHVMNYH